MTETTVEFDGTQPPTEGPGACDGAGDDALESRQQNAQDRGWGPGWPRCQTGHITTISAGGIRLSVHRDIAPLVRWLCDETVRGGYELRSGQCWGFACRAIRGSRSTPSNHSWGLAIDLNSLANPMGSTLVTDMPHWMRDLWTSHGFGWGGAYTGRKDAMHFEYLRTPAQAAKAVAQLGDLTPVDRDKRRDKDDAADRDDGRKTPGPLAFPLPDGDCFAVSDGSSRCHDGKNPDDRPHITRIQRRLVAQDADLGAAGVDGRFGQHTERAVRAFQRSHDLTVDGQVGPVTWKAALRDRA